MKDHSNVDLRKDPMALENWNVSNVDNMKAMFYNCENFNCDLSKWDVSNVKCMSWMFINCNSLKNIPSWYKE